MSFKYEDFDYDEDLTPAEFLSKQGFEVEKELGRGTFATVFKAVCQLTGEVVAVKALPKSKLTKCFKHEIQIMMQLSHPNLIKMAKLFESKTHVFLVLEYMSGGELFGHLEQRGCFNEQDASQILKQLLEGVAFLHSNKVAHRDLKPENILCSTENGRVVIADFGLAKVCARGKLLKTSCGTPQYAAPEIVRGSSEYDTKVDMWSVGVISYVLLAGFFPFFDKDIETFRNKVLNAEYSFPDGTKWDTISSDAKDFVSSFLVVDPTKRIDADAALKHPWIIHGGAVPKVDDLRASGVVSGMELC